MIWILLFKLEPVLDPLYMLVYLIFVLWRWMHFVHFIDKITSPEKSNNLFQITQLVTGRAKLWTQVCLTKSRTYYTTKGFSWSTGSTVKDERRFLMSLSVKVHIRWSQEALPQDVNFWLLPARLCVWLNTVHSVYVVPWYTHWTFRLSWLKESLFWKLWDFRIKVRFSQNVRSALRSLKGSVLTWAAVKCTHGEHRAYACLPSSAPLPPSCVLLLLYPLCMFLLFCVCLTITPPSFPVSPFLSFL